MHQFSQEYTSFAYQFAFTFFLKFNTHIVDRHLDLNEQITAAHGDAEILEWLQSIDIDPDDPFGEVSLKELTRGIEKAIDDRNPILIKLFACIVNNIGQTDVLRHFLTIYQQSETHPDQQNTPLTPSFEISIPPSRAAQLDNEAWEHLLQHPATSAEMNMFLNNHAQARWHKFISKPHFTINHTIVKITPAKTGSEQYTVPFFC